MDRQEQIRTKADISTVAMRATVKIHLEDLDYEFEETPWGGEEDLQNLTDYFVLRNGKPQWRGQHKHSKGEVRGYAIIRYQRSSGRMTDFLKLFKLSSSLIDNLIFTFTYGKADTEGAPYWSTPASSIVQWARDHTRDIEDFIGSKATDSDGAWSTFLHIPFEQLGGVEEHRNYLETPNW